jgi:hypothetical protein
MLPAGFVLQSTVSLAEPVLWNAEAGTPVEHGGFFRLTVPVTGTNRFYRLHKP